MSEHDPDMAAFEAAQERDVEESAGQLQAHPPLGSGLHPMELAAIKASGVPGWRPWIFEKVKGGIRCTGAVCPPVTRGPRKGEPNFRRPDKATRTKVVVTAQMIAAARDAATETRNG
jgi:hypothetical protein